MRSDERGQMMLLAAVVLVVAFLSLSVLVGRISTIEGQTLRDVDQPLLVEADAVRRGACVAMETGTPGIPDPTHTGRMMDFLALQLAGRGFFLTYTVGNDASGAPASIVSVVLRQGPSSVAFDVAQADC